MNQRRLRRDQLAQPLEIAAIDRGESLIKPRMRFELRRRGLRRLDPLLELCPVVESIFAREHKLRIGKRQRPVEDRLERLALQSGMIRDDARRGGQFSLAMGAAQLAGLKLELVEVGTGRKGTARHGRSFRNSPMSACGPKEALVGLCGDS